MAGLWGSDNVPRWQPLTSLVSQGVLRYSEPEFEVEIQYHLCSKDRRLASLCLSSGRSSVWGSGLHGRALHTELPRGCSYSCTDRCSDACLDGDCCAPFPNTVGADIVAGSIRQGTTRVKITRGSINSGNWRSTVQHYTQYQVQYNKQYSAYAAKFHSHITLKKNG